MKKAMCLERFLAWNGAEDDVAEAVSFDLTGRFDPADGVARLAVARARLLCLHARC